MTKLLILDKDGTLTQPKSGERWVQSPEDQEFIPGVAEALAWYRADGWVMAIASNQGGVASGHKTLGSAIDEMFFAMRLTGIDAAMAAHSYENEYGEAIFLRTMDQETYWRPVSLKAARFRKPGHGMISYLSEQLYCCSTSYEQILFVGDRPEDEGAARSGGVEFCWALDWLVSTPTSSAG